MPPFVCLSICPSVTLSPPKPLGGILPNLLHQFPHGKCVQEQHYFSVHQTSVHPSSVHLSVCLSPPKPMGEIQQNLLHHFPSWSGCARATLFFCVLVRPCIHGPFIYLSCYLLLNHRAEFNQTFYITSPHGKGVQEQHFFPCVCHPSICSSRYLLLNHWVEFNQTCYITSPYGKGMREQHYFSIITILKDRFLKETKKLKK